MDNERISYMDQGANPTNAVPHSRWVKKDFYMKTLQCKQVRLLITTYSRDSQFTERNV